MGKGLLLSVLVALNISAQTRYVGSTACKTCHSSVYERWSKTTDGERSPRPEDASGRDSTRPL